MKETFKDFVKFAKLVQKLFNLKIITLKSDCGGEFVSQEVENFCNKNGRTLVYVLPNKMTLFRTKTIF